MLHEANLNCAAHRRGRLCRETQTNIIPPILAHVVRRGCRWRIEMPRSYAWRQPPARSRCFKLVDWAPILRSALPGGISGKGTSTDVNRLTRSMLIVVLQRVLYNTTAEWLR